MLKKHNAADRQANKGLEKAFRPATGPDLTQKGAPDRHALCVRSPWRMPLKDG